MVRCWSILLSLAVCWASPAQVRHTEIRLLTPITQKGIIPSLNVVERLEGSCWTDSLASSSRPDTWRCAAGNRILEPCFASGFEPKLVACLSAPWENRVIELTLKSPLPETGRKREWSKDAKPCALELANGHRCTLLTGATAGIAGMPMNYGCSD